jgi:hypothetical protein
MPTSYQMVNSAQILQRKCCSLFVNRHSVEFWNPNQAFSIGLEIIEASLGENVSHGFLGWEGSRRSRLESFRYGMAGDGCLGVPLSVFENDGDFLAVDAGRNFTRSCVLRTYKLGILIICLSMMGYYKVRRCDLIGNYLPY